MPKNSSTKFEKDFSRLEKLIIENQQGGVKEYTGTYRYFTLHEVNGKEVEIGKVTIKDNHNPLDAAKKLLSS
jgi:hypothetical protein